MENYFDGPQWSLYAVAGGTFHGSDIMTPDAKVAKSAVNTQTAWARDTVASWELPISCPTFMVTIKEVPATQSS